MGLSAAYIFSMQADFAIELGREDETLEFPWAAPDGGARYHDLKRHPESLSLVEEARRWVELKDFLSAVNAAGGSLETAKCDAWGTTDIHPEEEIFGATWKFGSYVDLVFSERSARFSVEDHETLLKQLTALLKRAPEINASAEFLLRRCFYHEEDTVREGLYVTFYLFGFGNDEGHAQQQWGIALKLVSNAIGQLSFRNSSL